MLRESPVPRPRPAPVTFDDSVPRHWFAGLAVPTHIVNGVNLLFPAGERFFIRSVRHYLDRVDDPLLREQIKGFFGQEGRHAHAHEQLFERLEAQGYKVRGFLAAYERFAYGMLEPAVPPVLRLAVTVAAEHFTAIMAERALTEGLLDHAHPALRGLLLWHAAEEIEHKSVAFDVLKAVQPSYAVRMAGLALAGALLAGFWVAATGMLLLQDGDVRARGEARARRELFKERSIVRNVFLRGIKEYVRRDFHPTDSDNAALAQGYLASVFEA